MKVSLFIRCYLVCFGKAGCVCVFNLSKFTFFTNTLFPVCHPSLKELSHDFNEVLSLLYLLTFFTRVLCVTLTNHCHGYY